jgi:hypothetical protein
MRLFSPRSGDRLPAIDPPPLAPLPRTDEDPDVLHVTRTWNFLPGGELVDE